MKEEKKRRKMIEKLTAEQERKRDEDERLMEIHHMSIADREAQI